MAPTAVPMASAMSTDGTPPNPCGSSQVTMMQLTTVDSGPIDRSTPAPPDRIDGVLGIAWIAKGASTASSPAQLPGRANDGCTAISVTSSAIARKAANGTRGRCSQLDMLLHRLSEEARDQLRAVELAALQLAEDAVLAEDEHPVHQLDMLVDLG